MQEDGQPGMRHIFVHLAVQSALCRAFRDRELISLLLVALSPTTLDEAAISMAFTRLLSNLDDLVLDVPDAVHLLTLFLARLVVDEVVPPVFLTKLVEAQRHESLGIVVVRNTAKLLSAPHAAERVLQVCCLLAARGRPAQRGAAAEQRHRLTSLCCGTCSAGTAACATCSSCRATSQTDIIVQCWHGGLRNVQQLQSNFTDVVKEFLASGELAEAVRSLHELGAKAYHHEFVRRCVDAAYEKPEAREKVVALLQHLSTSGVPSVSCSLSVYRRAYCRSRAIQKRRPSYPEKAAEQSRKGSRAHKLRVTVGKRAGEVSQTQLGKGLGRARQRLPDSTLDCPAAASIIAGIIEHGHNHKWLDADEPLDTA